MSVHRHWFQKTTHWILQRLTLRVLTAMTTVLETEGMSGSIDRVDWREGMESIDWTATRHSMERAGGGAVDRD